MMEEKINRGIVFARLVAGRKVGMNTEEEERRLDEELERHPEWRDVYEECMRGGGTDEGVRVSAREAWKEFGRRHGLEMRRMGLRRWMWLAVAGMAVLCVGLGRLFLREEWKEGDGTVLVKAVAERSDAVCLEMPDGAVVNLGGENDALLLAEGMSVDRKQSELGHCLRGEEGAKPEGEGFYTLFVPKYGEYTVRFPDGSVVKVNSESRLRYPVRFGEGRREVWLEGEAYFEVARDEGASFTVHTERMDVRVLGTVFHVAARPEEGCAEATLLSGSVEAVCGRESVRLVPGEQAKAEEEGKGLEVRRVNVRAVTAWVRGMFCFEEERLEDILAYLSEWYGFRVDFRDARLKDRRFSVEVKRYGEAHDVLRLIEETGAVRFREAGLTVEVLP